VLLIESDARAAKAIRSNIAALAVADRCRLVMSRLPAALAAGAGQNATAAGSAGPGYDVVFADPPYATPGAELGQVLGGLAAYGWLAGDAVVVIERSARSDPVPEVDTVTVMRSRRYGESVLWYFRGAPAA
jgi:16S rRNA G966 N2-methylase RsmD